MSFAAVLDRVLDVKQKSGDEWSALCPFHNDTKPSLRVNVRKGQFICHACGERGNVNRIIGGEASDYYDAVDEIETSLKELEEMQAELEPADIPETWLPAKELPQGWEARGITSRKLFKLFDLGADASSLVMPVRRRNSVARAVIRRMLSGTPKYHHSPGWQKSTDLYGLYECWKGERGKQIPYVCITEGPIDALACWQAGFPSVAVLGSELSSQQASLLRMLSPIKYVAMTDKDEAGRKLSKQIEGALRQCPSELLEPMQWPSDCKDPADMKAPQIRATVFSADGLEPW